MYGIKMSDYTTEDEYVDAVGDSAVSECMRDEDGGDPMFVRQDAEVAASEQWENAHPQKQVINKKKKVDSYESPPKGIPVYKLPIQELNTILIGAMLDGSKFQVLGDKKSIERLCDLIKLIPKPHRGDGWTRALEGRNIPEVYDCRPWHELGDE